VTVISAPTSPSNLSTVTLVGSDNADNSGVKSVEPDPPTVQGKQVSYSKGMPRYTHGFLDIKVTVDECDFDSAREEDQLKNTRRGSVKLVSLRTEEPMRRNSVQETATPEKEKQKEPLKFPWDIKKSSSMKKRKDESKKEKSPSRFSEFLLIDNKLRRHRSRSSERRTRTSRRKDSDSDTLGTDTFVLRSFLLNKGYF